MMVYLWICATCAWRWHVFCICLCKSVYVCINECMIISVWVLCMPECMHDCVSMYILVYICIGECTCVFMCTCGYMCLVICYKDADLFLRFEPDNRRPRSVLDLYSLWTWYTGDSKTNLWDDPEIHTCSEDQMMIQS